MSSTPLDLPILISQLPFVQKIAHAEKAKPEIRQQLFGPMIQEQVKKQEGMVQQVQKKSEADPVDRDGRRDERPQSNMSERNKKEDEEEESPDSGASSASPWAGNIVNVKI